MLISRRTFFGLTSAGTLAMALTTLDFSNASAQNVSIVADRSAGFKVLANGVAQAVIVIADAPSAVVQYVANEIAIAYQKSHWCAFGNHPRGN